MKAGLILMRKHKVGAIALLATAAMLTLSACTTATNSEEAATPPADVVATIDSSELVRAGHLTTCMDMPYQPFQYFDENGDPTGVDIDLVTEVAARLGLKPNFQNSVFDTIIAALNSGKCDMLWADQYVTPERVDQLDMVAYWRAAEVVVVADDNPKGITSKDDLCGLKAAGQKGGADVAAIEEMSTACVAAGKPAIEVLQFPRSPDAYQALVSGAADAWVTEQVAALLLQQEKGSPIKIADTFYIGGDDGGKTAFSFRKGDSTMSEPVMAAVQSMIDDGTWAKIWEKWGLTDAMIDPPEMIS